MSIDIPIFFNDLQLAQLARTDNGAEEKLFCRLYPRIMRIVWLVLGDEKRAEDVAQIAALQVFKSLDSFKGLGAIESWAERIAYRTAVKESRKEKKKNDLLISLNDREGVLRETPETTASRRQLFELLISKMKGIPEKRRIPLLLHLAYGYTVREVSALMETSQNTVKARLKKGNRELRAILSQNRDLFAAMEEELP